MNAVATKPRKNAQESRPAQDGGAAFLRGRDLAIAMACAGRDLWDTDDAEARRWCREGRAQNRFAQSFLAQLIAEPTLLDGFAAALSAVLGVGDAMEPDLLRDMCIAEFEAGRPGDDGTAPGDPDDTTAAAHPEAVTVTSNPEADAAADMVSGHYKHALSVLELVAHEMNQSGLVFAARNLMRAELPRLMEAFDKGEHALEEASADLWVVLELLAAAAHTVDDEEQSSCVWGAHALATLSMAALDEHILDIKRSGAAS